MDHYLEIQVLSDPEFSSTVLLNCLYSNLHLALVKMGRCGIGVSFPEMDIGQPDMGKRLRLCGKAEMLQQLMLMGWLGGMSDHVEMGKINPVPPNVSHRVVRRVQVKTNPERLRRRLAKRKGISVDEARQLIPDSVAKHLTLPFVTIRSQSTGQNFRLFIEQSPLQTDPVHGEFSFYGLSSTATIPWF